MLQFTTVSEIKNYIKKQKSDNKLIGFVPTMGALHEGHLSLVKRSLIENDITVVSIFVNPIQFNNKTDLKNYPRTLDADLKKIEYTGCDITFVPAYEEMYPNENFENFDFGELEKVMEGAMRPGHFNGVAVVVKRFFEIIIPDRAYFGEKDFQQLLIIKALVQKTKIPIKIVPCKIIREESGLAMSSRNELLSESARIEAKFLYDTLVKAKKMFLKYSLEDVKQYVYQEFNNNKSFKLDYFEVVDENTLQTITKDNSYSNARAFIAAYIENVRLIDNISFK